MELKHLVDECHDIALSKGWWDKSREDGTCIALMHSELSEALEEMRGANNKNAIGMELGDVCIRIFDYCGRNKIDLEDCILRKCEINKGRPNRHNKRF